MDLWLISDERFRLTPLIFAFSLFIFMCLPVAVYAEDNDRHALLKKIHDIDGRYKHGGSAFDNGNIEEAVELWEKTAADYGLERETAKQIDALVRLSVAYQYIGHYMKSMTTLELAKSLSAGIQDSKRMAVIYGGYGQYYFLTGDFNEAAKYFIKGLSMARDKGSAEVAADIQNNYGNLLVAQKRLPEAIAAFKECISKADEAGRLDFSVRALVNMARAYIDMNRPPDGRVYLEHALERIPATRDTVDKVYNLIAAGRLMSRIYLSSDSPDMNDLTRALASLKKAEEIAGRLTGRRAYSYATGYLGTFYEQARHYDGAMLLTQRAILAAQQSNANESLYRWYWQKGRIFRKQGRIDEAVTVYRQALKSLNTVRQDVSAACTKRAQISFREAAGPVHFELADILLQRSTSQNNADQAKQDLFEARNVVEQLKGAELQDYFQDDCVVALKTRVKNLDQIIQKTAVVYFILLPDRIELLVTVPGGLKQFTVPVGAGLLNQEVLTFRDRLERASDDYLENAQQIYAWLIRPLEKALMEERIDTLIFIPDGMLRTIPMGALHDGKDFLIGKYTVVTTPGITLTDPQPISRDKSRILLGGLSESVQGFPALPNVTSELLNIQKLYNSVVFQDREFLHGNVEKAMKGAPYNIVHIASHGQFDGDPQKTFLLTYNDKLSMNQLEKLIGQGQFRDQPVELITLSACQTAVGDDRAALGLAGIAIKAGARSAVASLWSINDEATSRLMVEFYRQLQNASQSKAKALQQAQQKMLSDKRFHHPAYWAPFILIGNWL